MKALLKEYISLILEKKVRRAKLSGGKLSEWGSDEHIRDLEKRYSDAIYWRDSLPRGSEKRSHYRAICGLLKNELQSAKHKKALLELQIED